MQNDLIDLQTRIAYQEDMIATLNDRVAEQERDIQHLQQQLRLLAQRVKEIQHDKSPDRSMDVTDERPPHY